MKKDESYQIENLQSVPQNTESIYNLSKSLKKPPNVGYIKAEICQTLMYLLKNFSQFNGFGTLIRNISIYL